MALDSSADFSDLDSRRTCDLCKTRMSSLLHDKHSVCVVCRGFDCSLDKHCIECESWPDDLCVNTLNIKILLRVRVGVVRLRSLHYGKSDPGSHSTFGESSANTTGLSSSSSAGVSEDRVFEIVNSQFAQLSSSFAASMEASFANIQSLIDDRLSNYVSQDINNASFAAPSPVPVYQAPSHGQTDPSLRIPHTGFGPGGETEEPGQDESATSSFLAALNAAGISVPQGVVISARESSSGSGQSVVSQAGAPQGVQAEVTRGDSVQSGTLRASGSTATKQVNLGASTSGVSPHEEAFRAVSFADVVQEFADDNAMSSASDKGAVSEGHRNVLRLLYQLCPAAAPESPPAPRRVCDF